MVRITTWNVNGIRNPFGYQPWRENRTFEYMFDTLEADIVIMQELKIQRKDLTDDMVLVPGWDCYFSLPKHKKGYSGVAIYTRQAVCAPIHAEEGLLGVLNRPGSSTAYRDLPDDEAIGGYLSPSQVVDLGVDAAALDAEGRCVILEFPAFVLFGIYSPANSNGLRDDFRYGFLCALETRIRNLTKMGKRVVLTGDLNVSREEIDSANAEESIRQAGWTREEYLNSPNRRVFNQLLENGNVPGARDPGRENPVLYDLCREMHPEREGMFTHWEQKINARPGNFGSRIDYVLCSIEMKSWFDDANIQEGLMGSDHCPVYAKTKEVVDCRGEQIHMVDLMNAPGMFEAGVRIKEYIPARQLLPLSGKLLPEFDKRRNIRDMFKRVPSTTKATPTPSREVSEIKASNGTSFSTASQTPNDQDASHKSTAHPLEPPTKRPAPAASPTKSVKKTRLATAASPTKQPSTSKGQQSLKGFFAPKTSAAPSKPKTDPKPPSSSKPTLPTASSRRASDAIPTRSPSPPFATEPFIDTEASKASWASLFSQKPPPRCEGHGEPCTRLKTKKVGPNQGREFWMCPRTVGPTGQKKSNGTEWRCGTFIWASDWNAPSSQG